MPTITRFAPSPSGSLHLGGARTALFNYLYAKSNDGSFHLRIEDSDKERSSKESIDSIINGLRWLGIDFSEPITFQSNNYKRHIEIANQLLSKNLAYKCFHDQNYVKNNRSLKKKFQSKWRDIPADKYPKNQAFSIRLKSPINGICKIKDKIQGIVEVKYEEIDDYILLRSDGSPTFLLSSAVDDYDMKVTDIIRGDDHLTNSFRQKVIFDFLEYKPNFAHISLIHNENNQKLSKRDNAPSILEYKKKGYLSKAINNYLMRLGWSFGEKEIFTIEEIKKKFSLENIGKSPSKHDKKKLDFLNNYYLKITDNKTLLNMLREVYDFESLDQKFKEKNIHLINLFKDRANNLCDIFNNISNFNISPRKLNIEENELVLPLKENKDLILNHFNNIDKWSQESIEKQIKETISKIGIGFKNFAQPIRCLILGQVNGPSISDLILIVGKQNFIKMIKSL